MEAGNNDTVITESAIESNPIEEKAVTDSLLEKPVTPTEPPHEIIEKDVVKSDSPSPELAKSLSSGALKTTTRIPSISPVDPNDNPPGSNSEDADAATKAEPESFRNEVFELKDLQEAWKEFASLRRKKGKAQEQHIFVQPYELMPDGFTITLELNNSLQTDILEEIRSDLVQYLRNKLENDSIILEAMLKKENGKKMLYTNKEKLDHMAEKNPLVNDLQNKLGLDPDY